MRHVAVRQGHTYLPVFFFWCAWRYDRVTPIYDFFFLVLLIMVET